MITCKDAEHLFDRYLDGELSPSLQTELHAHRLACTDCQNELAMMEACGDVIALDRREPALSVSFTDRVLLARRAQLRPVHRHWGRRLLLIGSPMAAAASIALAVLLIAPTTKVIPPSVVAGVQVENQPSPAVAQTSELQTEASVGMLEDLVFAPLVGKSRDALEGTVRGAEELAQWIHLGLAEQKSEFADTRPNPPAAGNTGEFEPSVPSQQNVPQQAAPEVPHCAYEPL